MAADRPLLTYVTLGHTANTFTIYEAFCRSTRGIVPVNSCSARHSASRFMTRKPFCQSAYEPFADAKRGSRRHKHRGGYANADWKSNVVVMSESDQTIVWSGAWQCSSNRIVLFSGKQMTELESSRFHRSDRCIFTKCTKYRSHPSRTECTKYRSHPSRTECTKYR